nr:50S ribosomal protein L18P [uncultured archaeon]
MPKKLVMPYRRKQEGRTDYKRRLVLLKSGLARLVIRTSNKSVQAQVVVYEPDGDRILATARATDLKKFGWKSATGNTPAAYLTGMLIAHKLASVKKYDGDIIVDIGLQKHHPGGRIYAVVKGAIDGGLPVRVSDEALPDDSRVSGAHINESLAKELEAVKTKLTK